MSVNYIIYFNNLFNTEVLTAFFSTVSMKINGIIISNVLARMEKYAGCSE
jgi:hypothetical protein